MTARGSLVAGAKRLGSAVLWIVLFVVVGAALSWVPVRFDPLPEGSAWRFAVQSVVLVVAFGLATWLVGVRLVKLSWAELGWRPRGGTARQFARGTAFGVVMAALAVGLSVAGGARVGLEHDWRGHAGPLLALTLALLAAALVEELMFRGFPLRRLAVAVGPAPATALLAVLFGVVHVRNPNASVFGTVNIALAAIFLSLAFFSPGGMALAWGLHFGWNAGLGLVFDAPVSGIQLLAPPAVYSPGLRGWLDGGAFGPEGGVVGTVALGVGVSVLLWARRGRGGRLSPSGESAA